MHTNVTGCIEQTLDASVGKSHFFNFCFHLRLSETVLPVTVK